MDPQTKGALTSMGLAIATGIATWAAGKGIIPGGDAGDFANILVSIGGYAVAALIGWYKLHQLSQPAMIKAVNAADNGVTVVPTTSVTAALQVNAPLKGSGALPLDAAKAAAMVALMFLGTLSMLPGRAEAKGLLHKHHHATIVISSYERSWYTEISNPSFMTATAKVKLPIPLPIDPLGLNGSSAATVTAGTSPAAAVANGLGLQSLTSVLTSMFNSGTSTILADMASADSVAGVVDPNSQYAPPYNLYQYNAHMCIAAAQPWLQSASGVSFTGATITGTVLSYTAAQGLPAAGQTLSGQTAGTVAPGTTLVAPINATSWTITPSQTVATAETMSTSSPVPAPTGKGGILTTLVVAEVGVSTAQEFITKLIGNGIPPAVLFNCSAWGQQLLHTPQSLLANGQSDFAKLLAAINQ